MLKNCDFEKPHQTCMKIDSTGIDCSSLKTKVTCLQDRCTNLIKRDIPCGGDERGVHIFLKT